MFRSTTRFAFAAFAALAAASLACGATEDSSLSESNEAALTSGSLDGAIGAQGRVEANEKFLGEVGQKLLFLGRDGQGAYIARRTRTLLLDAAYAAGGKAALDLSAHLNGRVSDATLLSDGRVMGVGVKDRGRVEYVLDGVKVATRAMLAVVVSADGKQQKVSTFSRLATQPYPDQDVGYRAYTLAGTSAATLADGRVAVGASVGLYDSNNSEARLYAFSVSDLDPSFDVQLWGGGRSPIYGATQNLGPARVTSVVESQPGTLLVGTGGNLEKFGDELARSDKASYASVELRSGAVAATGTVHGVADRFQRTVVGRFDDGRLILAGYNGTICRGTVSLAFLKPDLSADASLGGAQARREVHCVGGARDSGHVAAVVPTGNRIFVVTSASGAGSTVWALDSSGNVDATFATGGKVAVPGNASGAFVAGGYLYLQLWDSYAFIGGGAGSGGHMRRLKL